jgi:uncharacterized protein (TIRG00374 family)
MFSYGGEVLAATALLMVILALVIRIPTLYRPLIRASARLPLIGRFTGVLETMMQSAGRLMTLRALLFTVVISVFSWSFECLAFYYVFSGLDYPVPLPAATFTLAFSSIVGAVSLLPGGLGAAEGSIMGLLVKIVGAPSGTAAVATIIIRFCTLWFGVVIGLAALITSHRFLGVINRQANPGAGADTDDEGDAADKGGATP